MLFMMVNLGLILLRTGCSQILGHKFRFLDDLHNAMLFWIAANKLKFSLVRFHS